METSRTTGTSVMFKTDETVSAVSPVWGDSTSDAGGASVAPSASRASETSRTSATIDAILTVDAIAAHEAIDNIATILAINAVATDDSVSAVLPVLASVWPRAPAASDAGEVDAWKFTHATTIEVAPNVRVLEVHACHPTQAMKTP